jgi:tetratricopeptide (TPR) repeat protein
LALFGIFGKSGGGDKGGGSGEPPKPSGDGMEFSPEKAKRFFDRARSVHDTGQYEYAISLWLQGLRFEPNNLDAIRGFFASCDQFRANGATSTSKETAAAVAGSTPVHKFLGALLEWGINIREPRPAVKVVSSIATLNLRDVGELLGGSALGVCIKHDRPRKDWFVTLLESFVKLEMFDLAVQAGEVGMRLDPSDNKLSADVRNLSAQATMHKGGYENTGKEGGYRQNIKDAEKQRLLNEERSLVKTDEGQQKAILAAKAEYEASPTDRAFIRKYIQVLVQRRTPADLATAIEVAEKAFVSTQEFGFRKSAGDIRLAIGRGEVAKLKAAADANPSDDAARDAFAKAAEEQNRLQTSELELQVQAYPTNLQLKLELGKCYLRDRQPEKAIEQLQKAKDEPKQRSAALACLGIAFQELDWTEEATETFKQALEQHADANDEVGLELRYGLMSSLLKQAEGTRDLSRALEAEKIASAIAIQQIGYRDIRAKRDQLKALIAQLRQTGGAAATNA